MYLSPYNGDKIRTITRILVNARTGTTPHLIYSKFRGDSGRNGWVRIGNGGGRRPREFPGLYVSQTLSQPPKRIRLRHSKPRARQVASSVVWGSKVDMAAGISTWNCCATEKSFLFVAAESLCGATASPGNFLGPEDTVNDTHSCKPAEVIIE